VFRCVDCPRCGYDETLTAKAQSVLVGSTTRDLCQDIQEGGEDKENADADTEFEQEKLGATTLMKG